LRSEFRYKARLFILLPLKLINIFQWTPCSPGDVRIGTGVATTATTPATCTPATGGMLGDYLTIMGGISYPLQIVAPATTPTAVSTTDRFCDATWPSQITSAYVRCKVIKVAERIEDIHVLNCFMIPASVRPFLIHFRTDSGEIPSAAATVPPTDSSIGFCLRWQQNPQ